MSNLVIINESVEQKLRINIFSAVDIVNISFGSSLIVDSILFFDTYIAINLGSTNQSYITEFIIDFVCRKISQNCLDFTLVKNSCRFRGVDFHNNTICFIVSI